MLQLQGRDCLGNATRFVHIDGKRTTLGDSAEAATSSAEIAQQHECGSAVVPALADVRALSGFTDRVQFKITGQLLELVIILAHRSARLQPFRLGLSKLGSKVNLY